MLNWRQENHFNNVDVNQIFIQKLQKISPHFGLRDTDLKPRIEAHRHNSTSPASADRSVRTAAKKISRSNNQIAIGERRVRRKADASADCEGDRSARGRPFFAGAAYGDYSYAADKWMRIFYASNTQNIASRCDLSSPSVVLSGHVSDRTASNTT